MKKWLPWIITVLAALGALAGLRPAADKPGAMAVQEFGRLPVLANGRHQPLDSLARNALLQLRGKSSALVEPGSKSPVGKFPKVIPAAQWLAEVMMNQPLADTRPVFRIEHPQLKSLLHLPEENLVKGADGKDYTFGAHFSWNQLTASNAWMAMTNEWDRVKLLDKAKYDVFDQAVAKLANAQFTYLKLRNTLFTEATTNFTAELATYRKLLETGGKAVVDRRAGRESDEAAINALVDHLKQHRYDALANVDGPLLLPPRNPADRDGWSRVGVSLMEAIQGEPLSPALDYYARMADALRAGNTNEFNRAVADYRAFLAPNFAADLTKGSREHLFNSYAPFYQALNLDVMAALLVICCWFQPVKWDWLRRTALGLVVVAWAIHTSGLVFRMVLEGRPPVTNLYSSAIFIGWGAVVLGVVLERFYRDGIGLLVASVMGFLTLIIAHNLSLAGDTMIMLEAVLDTNFWLATHVVVVTLGYASTFVAGFLALTYLLRGLFTTSLNEATRKALTRMVYAIICFATLGSFVGTVLGGIWADQSWGRFWGWDAKENGALIIVLWNALILHARWGGLVRERGLMNLALVGNIVTSWSWFGVNMLGIGLHSYGFMSGAAYWLGGFIASQLLLIALGCLPLKYWRSFRGLPVPPPAPSPAGKPVVGGRQSPSPV